MSGIPNKEWVKKQLSKVTCTDWDRFTVGDWGDGTVYLCLYGWIDRQDSYKDFVHLLVFPENEWLMFTTSSDKYTNIINKQLFDEPAGHNDCKRIENHFEIKNKIELDTEGK